MLEDGIDLDRVLRQMTRIAMELTEAEFGALGVLAEDGSLARLIHLGASERIVARLGALARGEGPIGALGEESGIVRIGDIAEDPGAVGSPERYAEMRSFLAAPVQVRDRPFGSLYLAHHERDWFDEDDEGVIAALARTAGTAIDHANLVVEHELRLRLSRSTAEVSTVLVGENADDALPFIAERVADLVDADTALILMPHGDDEFRVALVRGAQGTDMEGETFRRRDTLSGAVYESGQPAMSEHGGLAAPYGIGPVICAPLLSGTGISAGVLVTGRLQGATMFTTEELSLVADFAGQAAVALELARARADRERLSLLEDRARIARDLHDHVIQRLFAAGLNLQATAAKVEDPGIRATIQDQVTALDTAIGEIRTAIFALTAEGAARGTLRHRIIDAIGSVSSALPIAPQLSFAGAVDLLVPLELHHDVIAVVREGITNAIRHAQPHRVSVSVIATEDAVLVEVVDDGIGMPTAPRRRSGTANLAERAESWGGSMRHEPNEPNGTRLVWQAPYRPQTVSGGGE